MVTPKRPRAARGWVKAQAGKRPGLGELGQPGSRNLSLGFLRFCLVRITALGFHGMFCVHEAGGTSRLGVSTL